MLLQLNHWLIERFRVGETPVLIVDEAQGLSFELLEEIRLLLNLETASEKLLQIVLVGQPELEDKLKRPELRQLRQRITLRCNTAPLTLGESYGYIAGRLRLGGATGDPVFTADAVEAVFYYSCGIPRVMNLLCEHALINSYVEQFNPVPAQMVEEAARDFLMDEFRAFTTRSSVSKHMESKIAVLQSGFARELVRPLTREEAGLHGAPGAKRPAAPAPLAVEEPALTAENSPVATVPEREVSAASGENLNVSLSSDDLSPASLGLEPGQGKRRLSLDSISSQTDSAAELIATMTRMLIAARPISTPHLMPPRSGHEPLSAAESSSRRAQIRAPFLSFGWWRVPRGTVFLRSISPAAWSRVSAAVIQRIRQPVYPARALHRWNVEFQRDWISMINAVAFPQMKKSLLRWLCQPISSKPMTSSKN